MEGDLNKEAGDFWAEIQGKKTPQATGLCNKWDAFYGKT